MDILNWWYMPVVPMLAMPAYRCWVRRRRMAARIASLGAAGSAAIAEDAWAVAMRLASCTASAATRSRLREQLDAAGWGRRDAVGLLLLTKLGLSLLAMVVGLWWIAALAQPLALLKLLALVWLAGKFPDWVLAQGVRQRRERIRAAVPQAIDLLAVCCQAGLGIEEAFARVAREIAAVAPEVAAELRRTASELQVLPERSQAFAQLGKRVNIPELEYLAKAMIQSMHFGTPLAEALQAIGRDGRQRQIALLEERAGKMSARIGVPLIVLILFPLVVLMAAPALLGLVRTLTQASS